MGLFEVGKACQDFRKNLSITQDIVANETGYTRQNISAFEHGNNTNLMILFWYFKNGLTLEDLRKGGAL